MKKIGTYALYGGAMLFAIILFYLSFISDSNKDKTQEKPKTIAQEKSVQKPETKPAEKVQVFVFHSTQRCYSCITIGQFAKKTVEQKFPEEIKSGKIEFREINIDLPENKELAAKFKATGSSLYINSIVDGKDNIKQNMQVWRLVSNEQSFIDYLSDEIKKLL